MASKRLALIAGFAFALSFVALWVPGAALAAVVTLQNGTATCSQNDGSGNFPVDEAIDGVINNGDGWAVFCSGFPVPETAVFETVSDVTGQNLLIFQLHQQYFTVHPLGRFRLSATTASRSDFADGLNDGGNLGMPAIWTVLDPTSLNSSDGAILTEQVDNSILASGSNTNNATYTVVVPNSLSPITGIRLEALEDPSLPFNGPGRQPTNGNFVLTELMLHAEECVTDQLDIDDDNDDEIGALTDALLVLRDAFDFTGGALVAAATGQECMRCDSGPIAAYIDQLGNKLDIDADGSVEPLTDGLLILRYAFGFRGSTLIVGAIDPQCTRCHAFVIEAYLACLFS